MDSHHRPQEGDNILSGVSHEDKPSVLNALAAPGTTTESTDDTSTSPDSLSSSLLLLLDRIPDFLLRDAQVRWAILEREDDWKHFHATRILQKLLSSTCHEQDRGFVLHLVRTYSEAFRLLPSFWRDREDIVSGALAAKGTNLQYCSSCFRNDERVVRLACANDGNSFLYCGPLVADGLGHDREFILSILSNNKAGQMIQLTAPELRHDREIVLEALKHGLMYHDVPAQFRSERRLIQDAVSCNTLLYSDLPVYLKEDRGVAMEVLKKHRFIPGDDTSRYLIYEVSQQAQMLFHEEDSMLECAAVCDSETAPIIFGHCSIELRSNSRVAPLFVQRNCVSYDSVSPGIASQRAIYSLALTNASTNTLLQRIPHDEQLEDPEMVIRLMHRGDFDPKAAVRYCPRGLFRRLDVLRAYAANGGYLFRGLSGRHNADRDICLAFLVNDEELKTRISTVEWISETLQQDKTFLLEAIRVAPASFLQFVAQSSGDDGATTVQTDHDVLLAGLEFARFDRLQRVLESQGKGQALVSFARSVRRRIVDRDTFHLFLFGMGCSHPLRMLNLDEETKTALNQDIAAYAGTPRGRELRLLSHAWQNGVAQYLETKGI